MSDEFLKAVGDKFRTVRRYKNLSQQDVIDKTGMSRQLIYNIERGKNFASVSSLLTFAEALDCELVINLRLKEVKS